MIDVESTVFNAVITYVKASFPLLNYTAEYTRTPETFPCLMFYQSGASFRADQVQTDGADNYMDVTYEAQIYSNKDVGRKTEAKAIANLVEEKMRDLGFRCELCQPVMNADPTIFRIVMRFGGRVSKGVIVGDNTVYTIFKS